MKADRFQSHYSGREIFTSKENEGENLCMLLKVIWNLDSLKNVFKIDKLQLKDKISIIIHQSPNLTKTRIGVQSLIAIQYKLWRFEWSKRKIFNRMTIFQNLVKMKRHFMKPKRDENRKDLLISLPRGQKMGKKV